MKKQNLPQKICIICKRPFSWRKKWERDWEFVKYCSKKCQKRDWNYYHRYICKHIALYAT